MRCFFISFVFFIFSPTYAQIESSYKLNKDFTNLNFDVGASFLTQSISQNNEWVVFLAGGSNKELYSVPIVGGTPIKINGALAFSGEVTSFEISPDSKNVIYLAEQNFEGKFELFSVPIDGSKPAIKLNLPIPDALDVFDPLITPDSLRVVYTVGDRDNGRNFQIFSVPILGGPSATVHSISNDARIREIQISQDSQNVLFISNSKGNTGEVFFEELFCVSILGKGLRKLNASLVEGGSVSRYLVTDDAKTVIYAADQDVDDTGEIYRVSIDGGEVTRLNHIIDEEYDVDSNTFKISPDNTALVYRFVTRIPIQGSPARLPRIELFSVPVFGERVFRKLNSDEEQRIERGIETVQSNFQFTPDSKNIIYLISGNGINNRNRNQIYSVRLNGEEAIRLNGPFFGADSAFEISRDSRNIVYRSNHETGSEYELFSVPVNGGGIIKLNGPLVMREEPNSLLDELNDNKGGEVSDNSIPFFNGDQFRLGFQISPDNETVIYRADQDFNGVDEIYATSIHGGPIIKINNELPTDTIIQFQPRVFRRAGVSFFEMSNNGEFLIYIADEEVFTQREIFATRLSASNVETCFPIKNKTQEFVTICF